MKILIHKKLYYPRCRYDKHSPQVNRSWRFMSAYAHQTHLWPGRRPTQVNEGPQQPMTANKGQRRPTKTKRGPNDASGVVWAIICFFSNVQSICYFFITSPSTCSCFFSNKPRSEPEPGLGPLLGPGALLFEARAVSSRA